MNDPLVRALIAHLEGIFTGPNGDYPALQDSLAGLAAAQAAWKPAPGKNSIWLIVNHLTGSNRWSIDMLEKGEASPTVWAEPEVSEENWQRALDALKSTHARLIQVMDEQLTGANLMENPVTGLDRTLLELVLSSACAHLAYHAGQIDYLRGMQGI